MDRSLRLLQDTEFTIPESEYRQVREVVLIISAVLAGILIIAIIGRCCRTSRYLRCCNCWCIRNDFKKFKTTHNKINSSKHTEQEFDEKVSKILHLINCSKAHDNFTFLKSGLQHVSKTSIRGYKVQPFIYDIELDGEDFEGSFEGRGSIVCKQSGPLIWFFKDYDNKKKAQQEGDFKDIVFESFFMRRSGIGGKWFHVGQETSQMNVGKWKVTNPELNTNVAPSQKEMVHMSLEKFDSNRQEPEFPN